ncbi:hypothetical protein HMPREF9404_3482 [Eggerthella sp. HGA1]|nr:hypothetical protein HMPREF9404_3482 [Eggerthella sp. HGA1]
MHKKPRRLIFANLASKPAFASLQEIPVQNYVVARIIKTLPA